MKPDFTQLLKDNPDLITLETGENFNKYMSICNAMNEMWFPENKPLLKMDEIEEVTIQVEPYGILTFTMPYHKE